MTNQASEDETRKGIIGELSRVQLNAKDHPYSVTATDESDIEKAADVIQVLIRIEKLKLLEAIKSEWEKFGEGTNISDGEYAFLDIIEELESEL